MPDPRIASIRAAHRTTRELKKLFGQMGSTDHPRGKILRAYRNVRRGAKSAFGENNPNTALSEVLAGFRLEMVSISNGMLREARDLGQAQARADMEAWSVMGATERYDLNDARSAWLALMDAQIAAASTSPSPEYVLGGGTQMGILQPAPVIKAGAHWLASVAVGAWLVSVQRATRTDRRAWEWYKQAIPAIDTRTTDCCLRVAGQAVPLKGKFELTGTPRYADEQEWSPFHDYCRTSCALVPSHQANDELAQQLRADAQRQIALRREAKEEAQAIIDRLIELGTKPDSRRRKDDTEQIRDLRRRLLELRDLAGYNLEEGS
jgi:hypothetical protein